MPPLLETEDLEKTFGALIANDGISLTVNEGEVRGIIGPNGSGKSTFFNMVTGFYEPDSGAVRFRGEDITTWAPHKIARQGLARTFQIVSPFEDLTVRENLLAVHSSGVRVSDAKRDRADEVLEFLEIDHLANQEASEMSGGQQKLLELARVLMLDPECILLDEPTAGVNPALQDRILDRLVEMNEQGTTFIIVEHDMDLVREFADTVTVFDRGQVIAEDDFDVVTALTEVQDAYLGTEDAGGPERDVEAAGSAASPVDEDRDRLVGEDIVTGYGAQEILHGVSVRSHDGVTCIFGPNGSGKSTLIKALNGKLPLWKGRRRLGDRNLTDENAADIVNAGVVTVPQDGGLFPTMSVRENLLMGGYSVRDRDDVQARIDDALETFPDLRDKLGAKAQSLSGGQRMMLSFARALVSDADVFLLDEPSAGLQPSLVTDMLEEVEKLTDQGIQVILVEQNVKAALRIADHVYVLAQGEKRFDGTPSELETEDELIDLYLGLG